MRDSITEIVLEQKGDNTMAIPQLSPEGVRRLWKRRGGGSHQTHAGLPRYDLKSAQTLTLRRFLK